MHKFDKSCGLSQKQIGTIKYNVKNLINIQLPVLPELVETNLFFQGRDAWTYNWAIQNEKIPIESMHEILLEVVVKLKKEFHKHFDIKQYKFLYKVQLTENIYQPKISAIK